MAKTILLHFYLYYLFFKHHETYFYILSSESLCQTSEQLDSLRASFLGWYLLWHQWELTCVNENSSMERIFFRTHLGQPDKSENGFMLLKKIQLFITVRYSERIHIGMHQICLKTFHTIIWKCIFQFTDLHIVIPRMILQKITSLQKFWSTFLWRHITLVNFR